MKKQRQVMNSVGESGQQAGFKPVVPSQQRRAAQHPRAGYPQAGNVGGAAPFAPSEHSRESGRYSVKAKRKGRWKKVALVVVLVLLLCGGSAAAYGYYYLNQINQEIAISDSEEAKAVEQVLTPTVSDEPFWMLVVGSDTRGEDDARSDTNIAVHVDPKKGVVDLVSIPRDTAIELDGYGTQKFNAAYTYGGVPGAIKEAQELLGIKISHFVEIDFSGLVGLVDAMGGVEVDVPMAILDANAGGEVDQGLQKLDGEHALVFARSRSYVTGDFQRTTNQRLLVEAVIDKLLTMPATDLPNVIMQGAKSVTTDMKITDILGYAQTFQKFGDGIEMHSVMVPSTTATVDGISYVVCDTARLKQVMEAINAGEDPSQYVEDSTVSSSEEAKETGQESTPIYVPEP